MFRKDEEHGAQQPPIFDELALPEHVEAPMSMTCPMPMSAH
jgi:hypothetical protein